MPYFEILAVALGGLGRLKSAKVARLNDVFLECQP